MVQEYCSLDVHCVTDTGTPVCGRSNTPAHDKLYVLHFMLVPKEYGNIFQCIFQKGVVGKYVTMKHNWKSFMGISPAPYNICF